jgi:uncharacterized protein YbjT (DUF2867 family)
VIHVFGAAEPPVPRLIAALGARGHRVDGPAAPSAEAATLVLGPGPALDEAALAVLLGAWRRAPRARVLVLSLVGVHPDARAPRLRRLWEIEERARNFALPILTLRLAPLLGAASPLWLKLRSRPRLPRGGRGLINPVAEHDVLETLERALDGRARWQGWFEVAGEQALSLAELAALAGTQGPAPARGAWEPPLAEMAEHRLCDAAAWREHFGLAPRPITLQAAEWAA